MGLTTMFPHKRVAPASQLVMMTDNPNNLKSQLNEEHALLFSEIKDNRSGDKAKLASTQKIVKRH